MVVSRAQWGLWEACAARWQAREQYRAERQWEHMKEGVELPQEEQVGKEQRRGRGRLRKGSAMREMKNDLFGKGCENFIIVHLLSTQMSHVPGPGVGWACPKLLQVSPFLRACAQRVQEPHPAMAAALLQSLPLPRPSLLDLLGAGLALQALVEQPLPACEPCSVFVLPFSPVIAALPHSALLALLQASQLCAFPEPLATTLTACVAQRYASLPPAQFEAEVGLPCPRWVERVRSWWEAVFGAPHDPLDVLPSTQPPCFCAGRLASGWNSSMPGLAFGLLPGASASEYWARGLACSDAAPSCAALLALTLGHWQWTFGSHSAASAAALLLSVAVEKAPASARYSALVALLENRGTGCAVLAQQCCLMLWDLASECPAEGLGKALAALAGVLRAHPGDGCIAQCACAAVRRLISACKPGSLEFTFSSFLPPLVLVLCRPSLPPAATLQAALCLTDAINLHSSTPAHSAGLACRAVELLHWHSFPEVQLCAALVLANLLLAEEFKFEDFGEDEDDNEGQDAALAAIRRMDLAQPLARMLDSPLAQARHRAAFILTRVAQSWPGAGAAVLSAGALPPLLRGLHPYAEVVYVRCASSALLQLLSPLPCEATARAMLPRLAQLLSADEGGFLGYAIDALGALCAGGEGLKQAVLEAGCLPRLVDLLGQRSSAHRWTSILTALNSLAGADGLRLQAVLNADALPSTAALLLRRGRPAAGGCHEAACKLLNTVLEEGTCSQFQALLDAGCLQGLIKTARKGHQTLALTAGVVLMHAGERGSQLQLQQLAAMGGLQPVCRLLMACSLQNGQGVLGEHVLHGLSAMLRRGLPAGQLLQAGAGEAAQRLALGSSGRLQALARLVWEALEVGRSAATRM
jgi:hypothetical protein